MCKKPWTFCWGPWWTAANKGSRLWNITMDAHTSSLYPSYLMGALIGRYNVWRKWLQVSKAYDQPGGFFKACCSDSRKARQGWPPDPGHLQVSALRKNEPCWTACLSTQSSLPHWTVALMPPLYTSGDRGWQIVTCPTHTAQADLSSGQSDFKQWSLLEAPPPGSPPRALQQEHSKRNATIFLPLQEVPAERWCRTNA